MKDMFPRMEKKGINLNDLQYFKDVKRDEALRFISDKWAMVHNCEKNLEDIAEEMVTLTKRQGLLIKQETYQMEEMNLLERERDFVLLGEYEEDNASRLLCHFSDKFEVKD
jgi:hypothetical protein